MKNNVVCLRTPALTPEDATSLVLRWRESVAELATLLGEDEDDTALISVYCKHPEAIQCVTSYMQMEPSCSLEYRLSGQTLGAEAFAAVQPLMEWVSTRGRETQIRRIATSVNFSDSAGSFNEDVPPVSIHVEWNVANPNQQALLFWLHRKSSDAHPIANRAVFFSTCLAAAELGVSVTEADGRLTFETQPPCRVDVRDRDENPLMIAVAPFESLSTLADAGSRVCSALDNSAASAVVMIEMTMRVYAELVEQIPREFEGWKLDVFGYPSPATWAWLKGDVDSLPAGRIPIGDAWYGDENTGFCYSLSIVETAEGPALEAGTDEVGCERLRACLQTFFGELEFEPV